MKSIVPLFLLLSFVSYGQIEQNLVLNIDFDGDFTDHKNGHSITSTNMSLTEDRFGSSNSAANFSGWCSGNPGHFKVSNTSHLQFIQGFTISYWAKLDLNSGMNPADGTCSVNGHFVMIAKGGDGIGTSPNGIYWKYTDSGDHVMGTSPNSSSLYHSINQSNVNQWHMYTYVVTPNRYDFYLDGSLQQSVAHSLDFSELNNEDLYVGVLGPKSTPALGITDWFPITGQMDDLLIFNKALNQTEVDSLENFGQNSPSIARIESLNTNYILSGGRRYFWQNKIHDFLSGKYISSFNPLNNWASASFKIYFSKVSNDQVILKKEYDYSVSNLYSQIEGFMFIEFKGSLALLLDYPVQVPYDKMVLFDSSLNIISETQIPNLKATELLVHNDELVLITKSYDEASTVVRFYDENINQTNFTIISDNLSKVNQNDTELILSNSSGIYRLHNDTHTFLRQGLSSEHVYLTKEQVIMWKSNELVLFDLSTNSLLIAPVSSDTLLNNPDSTNFYLLSGNVITQYDEDVNPLHNFSIPTSFDDIAFSHNHFITRQRINTTEGTKYSLFNNSGVPLFTQISSYYSIENLNKVFFPLSSQNYILSFGDNTNLIDLNGSVQWSKNIGLGDLFVNNDLSLWLLTGGGYGDNLLVKLNSYENSCYFQASNPFNDIYCQPANGINHTLMPIFEGNFYPISYASPPLATLKKNYLDFGISFEWKKDNLVYSNDYFGEFTGNGNYSLVVKQGNCEVESPAKYVSFDSSLPNEPTLTTTKDLICEGETIEITSSCQAGSQPYWTDITYPSYIRTEVPSINSIYYSFCQFKSPRLDEIQYGGQVVNETVCNSSISDLNIKVINLGAEMSLTGTSYQSEKYSSGSILSTQKLLGTQINVDYISGKSIQLLPGFETTYNLVFKGEVYPDCPN